MIAFGVLIAISREKEIDASKLGQRGSISPLMGRLYFIIVLYTDLDILYVREPSSFSIMSLTPPSLILAMTSSHFDLQTMKLAI